jgi:hypothetical protein
MAPWQALSQVTDFAGLLANQDNVKHLLSKTYHHFFKGNTLKCSFPLVMEIALNLVVMP